jgi:hypothetical protein
MQTVKNLVDSILKNAVIDNILIEFCELVIPFAIFFSFKR